MLINHASLTAAFTGFKKNFRDGFESFGVDRTWDKFSTLIPSSTELELYGWLEDFPQFREWFGSRHVKDVKVESYQLVNRLWESTVDVKRTKIEDDLFGTYAPIFTELGAAAARHADELMYETLDLGDATVGYDGVNFFAATHPVGTGTDSNIETGGGGNGKWFLLDAKRPLKPLIYQQRVTAELEMKTNPSTSDDVFMNDRFLFGGRARDVGGYGFWQMAFQSDEPLSTVNFDDAVAQMMAIQSDNGMRLGIFPSLLVAGPANRADAMALLSVDRLASGASNKNFQAVDLLITPYLT